MAESTIWWLLAGAAVAVELATGTFYLLMLAFGLAAAALAAHAGASITVQLLAAAAVGGGAVLGWHLKRSREPQAPDASVNPDVNLDIGEVVHIASWNADGTASIKYRGANWTAIPVEGAIPVAGPHRVRQVIGSRLVVEQIP
jgi:membrane protein implicated in regulation of membrane protease activity